MAGMAAGGWNISRPGIQNDGFKTPGPTSVTGGGAPAPYASSTTDAQRAQISGNGNADYGKTLAQLTGQEPVRVFYGELQPGQSEGSGGIPPGATPSFNPASGKVEWMTISQQQQQAAPNAAPQQGQPASLAGLSAAGSGGAPSAPSGGASASIDAGAGGGDGGPSGAKVIDPASSNGSPASMQGLMAAGGDASAPGDNISGPTQFRGGIGTRLLPEQNSPLSGRKLY